MADSAAYFVGIQKETSRASAKADAVIQTMVARRKLRTRHSSEREKSRSAAEYERSDLSGFGELRRTNRIGLQDGLRHGFARLT